METIRERQIPRLTTQILGAAATEKFQRALLPHLRWNQEIYGEAIEQCLGPEGRWLDAGCGHHILGSGLERMERELKSRAGLMVGVDLQFEKTDDQPELPLKACANLDQLPFPNDAFQLITCNMVVEHLERPAVTFREFARVLTPGGRLVIHTPNVLGYAVGAGRVAKAVLPRQLVFKLIRWAESREEQDVFPTLYRANTMQRLKTLLGEAGLSERSCRYLLSPQPIFRRLAPVAFFELLLQRATLLRPLRFLRGTILVVFEKPRESRTAAYARSSQPREFAVGSR